MFVPRFCWVQTPTRVLLELSGNSPLELVIPMQVLCWVLARFCSRYVILAFTGYSSGVTVVLFDFIANMKFLIKYPEELYQHFLRLHRGVIIFLFSRPLLKT